MNFLALWNALMASVLTDGAVIWCVNVLLQASLVAVMALALGAWFRRSPAVRYGVLCCGLLLTLFCPLSVWYLQSAGVGLLSVSLQSADPPLTAIGEATPFRPSLSGSDSTETVLQFPSHSPTATTTVSPDNPSQAISVMGLSDSGQQYSRVDAPPAESSPAPTISGVAIEPQPTETSPVAVPTAPTSTLGYIARTMIPPVLIVWLSVAMVLLFRLVVGWTRVLRLLQTSERTPDEELMGAFRRACAALNISERIAELRTSTRLEGPIAAGCLRPTVVLPQTLSAQITDKQLHEILVHELAHVVRHDQIIVLLQNVTQAVFWLHPLVRYLNRQLAQAREEVCDNYVLAASDAPTYSRTLLTIAEIARPRHPLPGTVGLFTSRWRLESRIAGLLDARRSRMTKLTARGMALVALMAITLIGMTSLATVSLAVAEPQDKQEVSSDSAQKLATETTGLKKPEPGSLNFITEPITISGKVLDQSGKPVEDASVVVGFPFSSAELRGIRTKAAIRTNSAHDGTFSISYVLEDLFEDPKQIPDGAWKQLRHEICVAAIADGLGADWRPSSDIAEGQTILLTLTPSRSLVGRLVTIEGSPVPMANLRLKSLANTADSNIEPWLASLREGEEIGQATREHQLRSLMTSLLDRQTEYTTDESGRFEIPDIGKDQVATLVVTAPGIARQVVRMIARELEPMSTNSVENHLESLTLYGQQANAIVVAPSQPITGIVRDAKTREPLPGVAVESVSVAGSNTIGNRSELIRVHTDEHGRYRLEGLPKGKGNVLLAVPNDEQPYFMRELAVPVEDGMQPVKLDIELTRGVWLDGKVVDRDTQAPISAKVMYFPFLDNKAANAALGFNTIGSGFVDGSFSYQERYLTKRDGSFRIVVLPGRAIVGAETYAGTSDSYQKGIGSQDISGMNADGSFATYRNPFAASNKFPNVMTEIDIPEDGQVPPVQLEAVPGVPVRIRVVDADGRPVTGFDVSGKSFSSQWDPNFSGHEFEVTGLGPQDSRTILLVHQKLGIGKAFRITSALDRKQVVEIELSPCIAVRGRIIDENDAPIAHAQMTALTQPLEDYNPRLDGIATDIDGYFHFKHIPAGSAYRIEAWTQGRSMNQLQQIEFSAQAGQTVDVGTYRADASGKLTRVDVSPPLEGNTSSATPISKTTSMTTPIVATEKSDDGLLRSAVTGAVTHTDGTPAIGARVAVVASKLSGNAWPQPVVLSEGTCDEQGRFALSLAEATPTTHHSVFVVARSLDSAVSWQAMDLNTPSQNIKVTLRDAQSIQVRLVDSEGTPQPNLEVELMGITPVAGSGNLDEGIGFGGVTAPESSVIPHWKTDNQGLLTVLAIPKDHGVLLRVSGNDHIAPQSLLLNSGEPEQRAERDATYRSLVKNTSTDEIATLSLAPAQFFSGRVLLGDTNQPAAHARITMGASQQPVGGSSNWLEGRTDAEGYFKICPYPGINFQLIAYAPQGTPYHNKQLRDLKWESGPASEQLEVRLTKGVLVRGTIRAAETQIPLEGASVQYVPHDQNEFINDDIVTGWQSIQPTAADGSFSITTPPGQGTLLFHAPPESNYVLKMRGSRELSRGTPGGNRTYAHAFESLNLAENDQPAPLTVELQAGSEVVVSVVDPEGKPVDGFSLLSRLRIFPHSPQWRGFAEEIQGSEAIIRGLPAGEATPVYFLHASRKLGAMVMLDPKSPATTIQLQPCGTAIAHFVRDDGTPFVGGSFGLHVVVSPGKTSLDRNANRDSALLADEDFVSNIDRTNHWNLSSNDTGQITYPALIPGATYRFIDMKNSEATNTDFTVASGETRDLGECVIESKD